MDLIGKRVITYDGHVGVIIKHFKPTGRDMSVHIKQKDGRIWYCPENNIVQIIDDNKIPPICFLQEQISKAIKEEIDLAIQALKLQSISGYTTEQLIEMFLAGWEIKPPKEDKKIQELKELGF